MSYKVKAAIGKMQKLRGAISPGKWQWDKTNAVWASQAMVADFMSESYRTSNEQENAAFVAAAPMNQEKLERAVLFVVDALEKECGCWPDDNIHCEACKAIEAVETMLGDDT